MNLDVTLQFALTASRYRSRINLQGGAVRRLRYRDDRLRLDHATTI